MRVDPVTARPVPGLAERYEKSPDGRTYTFFLRTNLMWSTGERITAPERITTPPPPPPIPVQPTAEQNLAEMAQRLEAALRRPAGDASEPRIGAPPVAPEPPPVRPAPPPRPEQPMAPPVATPSPKSGFENLEDEMASLLGRPKNNS